MDDKFLSKNSLSDAAVAGARHLPLVAPWSVQTGASYDTAPFWQDQAKLRLTASYQHQGDYYSTVANLLKTDAVGLINASVALLSENDSWSLTLSGKNLADKEYFTTAPSNSAIAVGEPLTWTLTAGYKF
jgi:iron complex outermembrane receptor protein